MNYQRSKTEHKRFGLRAVIVCMLVLAALVCCFTVSVSAAAGDIDKNTDIKINVDNATVNALGELCYTKVYDGTTDVVGTVELADDFDASPYADAPNVEIVIDTVTLQAKDAGYYPNGLVITFKLVENGADAEYALPYTETVVLPVQITPATLTWAEDMEPSASVSYAYDTQTYTVSKIGDKTLAEYIKENLVGVLEDDTVEVDEAVVATLNGITAPGTYQASVSVDLGNYTVAPLEVDVTVEKLTVSSVAWGDSEYVYGDDAVYGIEAKVTDSAGKTWVVSVAYLQKNSAGEWEEVDRISGEKGEYKIYIPAFSDVIDVPTWDDEENGANISKTIQITHKKYKVKMNDATFVGDADLTIGENTTKFFIGVIGIDEDIPASILAQIKYYDADGNLFDGASAYGETFVTAKLPVSATDEFSFVNASGKKITSLSATITINRLYLSAGSEEGKVDVVVMNDGNGFASDVKAEVVLPEFDRNVLRGFPVHTEFTLTLSGIDKNEALVLYIPLSETLYGKNVAALTADDLYAYDSEKGELVKASELYTVTLLDGYYRVEGYTAAQEVTFVTAPAYNTPFWLSAPGIALITLIVLVVVILLFFIGLKSRKAAKTEDNERTVVDTVGERYEGKTVLIEGAPAAPGVNVDGLTANLEPEEEAVEETDGEILAERTRNAVDDSLQTLANEASKILLPREDLTPAEEATNALASKLSDELGETVGPDHEEVHYDVGADELSAAVADAMRMAVNESADATDAVALIIEEEPEEITPEAFRAVVDAIVMGAMSRTMVLPEEEVIGDAEEAPAEAPEAEEEGDVCAVVADVVAKAFDRVTVDGVVPEVVEGTTEETITEAVADAADTTAVPAGWTEAMAAAVKAAVVDELVARLLAEPVVEILDEEPEAVEAFAEVVENNEDDDDDSDDGDDDEDDGSFGFNTAGLTFIDVSAEPEAYNEMLEQERQGFVKIVYRYRRSYTSRMIQSQGNVQDYYNAIKNLLLSYKGVKGRVSWNYEAFNRGRAHVAKLNAKTKTLYLYLALDPAELADSKYGIVDMSSKKKYASVPVLMKIKGERKFKYALELIEKLCGEDLALQQIENFEETDYRMPYKTTDALVEEGVIKMFAAAITMTPAPAEGENA